MILAATNIEHIALLVGAIGAFIGVITQSYLSLRRDRKHDDKLDRIERAVNHVEDIREPGDDATLGQRVVRIEHAMAAGFRANNEAHDTIQERVRLIEENIDLRPPSGERTS